MSVQATKKIAMLQEWANQIREHKQSGMSVSQWSAACGYTVKTYYYRLRRVREELLNAAGENGGTGMAEKPVFAALPMLQRTGGAAVTVRLGQYLVEIHNGAEANVIEQTIKAVRQL